MAVTVTYDFQLLQSFEFPTGPSVRDVDLVGLANGGFAAVAEASDGNSSIEIFNGALALTGSRGPFANSNPGVIQLSNGNLAVVAASTQGEGVLDILDQNAQFVGGRNFFTPDDEARSVDIAALAGGNFVVAYGGYNTVLGDFRAAARIFNDAGTELLDITVRTSTGSLTPVIAALDDGGFVVAWEQEGLSNNTFLAFKIYNANGTLRRDYTSIDTTTADTGSLAITATDGGFAVVYEDDTVSANTDIALQRFEADGDFIEYGTLSGPATIDQTPSIARMPDGLLAISFGYSNISTADSETFAGLYNPFTRTFLAQRIGLMGNPITDDTDEPVVAGFGAGRLAYFHRNATDNDVDGEALEVVRTSTGDAGGDLFDSSSYRDIQNGGGGSDFLDGGLGDDTLNGEAGGDNLFGGLGNDILIGGTEIDTAFYTGTAAVTVNLSLTTAQNTGGAGIDTLSGIENLIGGNGNDILTGNTFANRLDGGSGNDQLFGGDGNDVLIGSQGNELYNGGNGVDTVDLSSATVAVTVNLQLSGAQNTGQGSDTFAGVENLTGSAHADTLRGDGFANQLFGGAGNDTLAGGLGADRFDGGLGTDTADFSAALYGVYVNLAVATAQNTSQGLDTFVGIDNLLGSAHADTLLGDGLANQLTGAGGNDTLRGEAGLDALYGGAGNDRLFGGGEADLLDGGTGNDRLDGGLGADRLYANSGGDTFVFTNNTATGSDRCFNFVTGVTKLEFDISAFGGTISAFAFHANANPNPSSAMQAFLYDQDNGYLYFDRDGTGAAGRVLACQLIYPGGGVPTLVAGDILLV